MKKLLILLIFGFNVLYSLPSEVNNTTSDAWHVLYYAYKARIHDYNFLIDSKDIGKLFDSRFVKDNITYGQDYVLLQNSLIKDCCFLIAFKSDLNLNNKSLNYEEFNQKVKNLRVKLPQLKYLVTLFGGNPVELDNKRVNFCVFICKDAVFSQDNSNEFIKSLYNKCFIDIHVYNQNNNKEISFTKEVDINKIHGLSDLKTLLQLDLADKGIERAFELYYYDPETKTKALIDSNVILNKLLSNLHVTVDLMLKDCPPELPTKMLKYLKFENTQTKVDFSNCGITNDVLKIILWDKLVNLKELTLKHNKLSVLPKELFDIPNLRQLDVSSNEIVDIDQDLTCKSKDKTIDLDLSNNKLQRLRGGWFNLCQSLNLKGNNLTDIPNDLLLWLFFGRELKIDAVKDSEDFNLNYIKELNYYNNCNSTCYICKKETPVRLREVRKMNLGLGDNSESIPLLVSSSVCSKCWNAIAKDSNLDNSKLKVFCWTCMKWLEQEKQYCCVKEAAESSNTIQISTNKKLQEISSNNREVSEVNDFMFKCKICNITCTSQKSLDYHFSGKKHKHQVEINNNQTYCSICDVSAANARGYQIHILGKNHKQKCKAIVPCVESSNGVLYGLNKQGLDIDAYYVYVDSKTKEVFNFKQDLQDNSYIVTDKLFKGEHKYKLLNKPRGKIYKMSLELDKEMLESSLNNSNRSLVNTDNKPELEQSQGNSNTNSIDYQSSPETPSGYIANSFQAQSYYNPYYNYMVYCIQLPNGKFVNLTLHNTYMGPQYIYSDLEAREQFVFVPDNFNKSYIISNKLFYGSFKYKLWVNSNGRIWGV